MLAFAFITQPVNASPEVLFFDDFNDGVADGWNQWRGTWHVDNSQYVASGSGNSTSIVNGLDLSDYVIEAKMRLSDAQGFYMAGIIFRRFSDSYYSFYLNKGSNNANLIFHDREAGGGTGWTYLASVAYPVEANVTYALKVQVNENTFRCYVNGAEVFAASDEHLTSGNVGLDVKFYDQPEPTTTFFDDFRVRLDVDLNDDDKVDGKDIATVALAFAAYPTHPRWNSRADLNEDNKIDGKDLAIVARNFGQKWT